MSPPLKLAIVSTHVIQHFPPLYRRLAERAEISPTVIYCSRSGLDSYVDPGFGVSVTWNSDLLSGYDHRFVDGADRPLGFGFWSNDSRDLETKLTELQPDVIFVYGYSQAMMLRALLFAARRRIPVLMLSDSELVHRRPLWKRALKVAVLTPLLRAYAGFITTGDNNEAYLERYGVPRSKFFRGALASDEPRFLAARESRTELSSVTRAAWGVAPDDFVALFVGKFIERKRAIDLVDATIALSRDATLPRKVVAVFAGDGHLRTALEEAVRSSGCENVRFIGFVNQAALPATYAAADVLVHAAEYDAHPLTVTESAMVGLPVIVSDLVGCVGPTDTARPGVNAIVYPARNAAALARSLKDLVMDPVRFAAMKASTLSVARETGLDACVDGIVRAAHTVSGSRRTEAPS